MWTTILSVVIALLALGTLAPKSGIATDAPFVTLLKVSPQALFAGQGVNLTCIITPHPDNRKIRMGVSETQDSERDLDLTSRKIHTIQVPHIPCEARVAYCIVTRVGGVEQMRQIRLTVLGCE